MVDLLSAWGGPIPRTVRRGPEVRQIEAVERWERQPRRIAVERLGGDPCHQLRFQKEEERIK